MNTEQKMKRVCDAWRIAAVALSIKVEAPYVIRTRDGKEVACIAHLVDFGGPNGMIIGLYSRPASETDKELKSAAESKGLFYSFINADFYERYDENEFKEALTDWGFFGDEDRRPNWLRKPLKRE
jgi:hypothetical protein